MDGTKLSDYRPAGMPGDAREPLLRLTEPVYGDGLNTPRPSASDAEQVAYHVFTQGDLDMPNTAGLSALWIFWGQFLDHDLSLTPEQHGAEAEFLKVDPPFSVVRSETVAGTGENGIPREQPNIITPLIDASNIYGSDGDRQAALRSFDGGHLKAQAGPDGVALLPSADAVFADGGDAFTAGDIRAQENPGLSAVHSLFVNEHNYWADRLAVEHPDWSDETLFQNAKVIVEMLVQKITYEEFLPVLVGTDLPAYQGYDETVDARISNEFATAGFRFGHTAIPDSFRFVNENGSVAGPAVGLFQSFDTPAILLENGLPAMLRGLLEARAQQLDAKVVDSLNYLLFTPDGGLTGFSLPERNILRGRDHGIDCYLEVREALVGDIEADDWSASTDFSVITSDPVLQTALAAVYDTVGEVDLWVGGLSEDHAPGVTVGATYQAILVDQFTRARNGDPLFYLDRPFEDAALKDEILATRLSDVLMRSGGIDHVQRDALLAANRIGGGDAADKRFGGNDRDLIIGFDGDDWLHGGGGDDDLFGDGGADSLRGGFGDDRIDGGNGDDMLHGGGGDDSLFGGSSDDWLHGANGDDALAGGAGGDTLRGGLGADTLDGGNGDDTLHGGAGADVLNGGGDDDWLHGASGSDALAGGDGGDTLCGGFGADTLDGGAGDDSLMGSGGDDTLIGGGGDDTLNGGAGADLLIIGRATGTDRIFGFASGQDKIGLADGLTVDDLSIIEAGRKTMIVHETSVLAMVFHVDGLDGDDFVLV